MRRLEDAIYEVSNSVDDFLMHHYYPTSCNLLTASAKLGFDKRTLHAYLKRKGYKTKGQSECQSGALNGFYGKKHATESLARVGSESKARQARMLRSKRNGRYGKDDSDYSGQNSPGYVNGIKAYRRVAFEKWGYDCVICGSNRFVDVHHRNEDRSDNREENLIVLCRTCHQILHKRLKKAREIGVNA